MRKGISILLGLVFFLNSYSQNNSKMVDGVIAVVGNNIITKSELESKYLQSVERSRGQGDDYCRLLEELLFQKLLLTRAQQDSLINVTDAQVEGELEKRLKFFITQFGSEEKFTEFYGKTVSEFKNDLRENIRELMLAQQMQGKITRDLSVTPAEVRNYFNSIPSDSLPFINSEVEVAHIVRKPPINTQAKAEAKQKCESIRERLLKGEDFKTLAVLYSEDPGSARKGGLYDSIRRGMFVPEFDAVAFAMKEGEVSRVFETPYGFHVAKIDRRRGENIDVRHILIAPKTSVEDLQKAKEYLDSIYHVLTTKKDSISFQELAGKISEDEESKNSGGLIMNPQTGNARFEMDDLTQIEPSAVFSIDKLKPGEFTKPLPYTTRDAKQAYRIIYLKARTEPHRANIKDDYQRLQSVSQMQKQQKLINDWIKKNTASMYIRIDEAYKKCVFEHSWNNL